MESEFPAGILQVQQAQEVPGEGLRVSIHSMVYDTTNAVWLLVVLPALVLMKCEWNEGMGLNVSIWDCFARQFCRKTCGGNDQVLIEGVLRGAI